MDKFSSEELVSISYMHAYGEVLTRHQGDDSVGYFVQPTVILTKDPKSVTMVEEIFGPVLTVGVAWYRISPLLQASRNLRSMYSKTPTIMPLSI